MNTAAIFHRSTAEYSYALDNDTVVVSLRTAKDVQKAWIIWNDPFINELERCEWYGDRVEMELYLELREHYLWRVRLVPKYKRAMYYFEVSGEDGTYAVYENKITPSELASKGARQFFKFPWLNPSDVIAPPEWVRDTVWYQIMPDRFNRGSNFKDNERFRPWGDFSDPGWHDLFGGNLKGITERLPYLRSLGISGVYMTPVFLSDSNHKYNTFDYRLVDPDFGTEEDLRELVDTAHSMGIRIMMDAVFNHCGRQFFAWRDVMEKGKDSPYYDWFFLFIDDFAHEDYNTSDGRFYTFSFWASMPKLNTNNPEVIKYFTDVCLHWVDDIGIDGIRFDVGDEVSHTFLRSLWADLKAASPDVFLLGEIWMDSIKWVCNREYDSVMNYPFCSCSDNFWSDGEQTSRDFMYSINYCRSLYPEQITNVLFNFLDTHDTARAIESCANENVFLQKLAVLMTMPGTPCIYYGTEIAMPGKRNPYNRACMPWGDIDSGKYRSFTEKAEGLIRLRNSEAALRSGEISFNISEEEPRLICYDKGGEVRVYINATGKSLRIEEKSEVLYSNGFDGDRLEADGILISMIDPVHS